MGVRTRNPRFRDCFLGNTKKQCQTRKKTQTKTHTHLGVVLFDMLANHCDSLITIPIYVTRKCIQISENLYESSQILQLQKFWITDSSYLGGCSFSVLQSLARSKSAYDFRRKLSMTKLWGNFAKKNPDAFTHMQVIWIKWNRLECVVPGQSLAKSAQYKHVILRVTSDWNHVEPEAYTTCNFSFHFYFWAWIRMARRSYKINSLHFCVCVCVWFTVFN